ncbi:MAG: hypothetical protein V3T24_01895, partial [Longimicrobiales bacterium]
MRRRKRLGIEGQSEIHPGSSADLDLVPREGVGAASSAPREMDEDGRRPWLALLARRRYSSLIYVHRVHSRHLVPRFGRQPASTIPTGV